MQNNQKFEVNVTINGNKTKKNRFISLIMLNLLRMMINSDKKWQKIKKTQRITIDIVPNREINK